MTRRDGRSLAYQLALRVWPRADRLAHGDEMIATARALSTDQGSTIRARAGELFGLLHGGVQTRYQRATGTGPVDTVASSVLLGVYLVLTMILGEVAHAAVTEVPDYVSTEQWAQTLASTFALTGVVLVGTVFAPYRVLAPLITMAVVVGWFWGPGLPFGEFLAYSLPILVAAWFLARLDHRPRRLPLVFLAVWILVLVSTGVGIGNYFLGHDLLMVALGFVGLLVVSADPRLLAGVGFYWLARAALTAESVATDDTWGPLRDQPTLLVGVVLALSSLSLGISFWQVRSQRMI